MAASALRAELERSRGAGSRSCPSCCAGKARVPGTAVFLVSQSGFVPTALLRNLEHNKVHHEQIVILHIEIQRVPRTDPLCRVIVEELLSGRLRRARALWLHGDAGCRRGAAQRAAPGPEGVRRGLLVLPRLAPGARAAAARASPVSSRAPSRSCSGAARRRRSSSACRRAASWCWPPTSKSRNARRNAPVLSGVPRSN